MQLLNGPQIVQCVWDQICCTCSSVYDSACPGLCFCSCLILAHLIILTPTCLLDLSCLLNLYCVCCYWPWPASFTCFFSEFGLLLPGCCWPLPVSWPCFCLLLWGQASAASYPEDCHYQVYPPKEWTSSSSYFGTCITPCLHTISLLGRRCKRGPHNISVFVHYSMCVCVFIYIRISQAHWKKQSDFIPNKKKACRKTQLVFSKQKMQNSPYSGSKLKNKIIVYCHHTSPTLGFWGFPLASGVPVGFCSSILNSVHPVDIGV